jgi:hypothetical protein
MKIRNIKSFKVFDLMHWKSEGVHTLVSLDLDGRRFYSIVLDGIRDVPSSEDVTVAFQDDEENSVLAWTDQKSREFFHVGGSSSLVACFFVFICIALLLAKFTGILERATPFSGVGFVAVLLSTCILVAGMYMRRRQLESAMRSNVED